MAKFVFKDASLTVNAVDLSDHVASVTLSTSADIQDLSCMGDTFKQKGVGLIDWSFDVTFRQDFAAGEVDATLWPLNGAAAFECILLPTSAAASATNPSYTGNCLLASYSPMGGGVGDAADAPVTLEGTGTLTRATS